MVQNAKVDVDRVMAILMVEIPEDLIVEAVIVGEVMVVVMEEVVIELNFYKKK